jgi:hypothetical protein
VSAISNLIWQPQKQLHERQARSLYWEYMGDLVHKETKRTQRDENVFCRLCFERELQNGSLGRLTNVYSLKKSTASGNLLNHGVVAHNLKKDENPKLDNWLVSVTKSTEASSSYELNRDVVVWLCRDLLPFNTIEKQGFQDFNDKNLHLELPRDASLATTCLRDVYIKLKEKVSMDLKTVPGACVMMDGLISIKDIHISPPE